MQAGQRNKLREILKYDMLKRLGILSGWIAYPSLIHHEAGDSSVHRPSFIKCGNRLGYCEGLQKMNQGLLNLIAIVKFVLQSSWYGPG